MVSLFKYVSFSSIRRPAFTFVHYAIILSLPSFSDFHFYFPLIALIILIIFSISTLKIKANILESFSNLKFSISFLMSLEFLREYFRLVQENFLFLTLFFKIFLLIFLKLRISVDRVTASSHNGQVQESHVPSSEWVFK